MATEPWLDYPLIYDRVQGSVFFDELRINLEKVTQDYVGLGVEDEQALILEIRTLFKQQIVPSRKDWEIIERVLLHLARIKEFSAMYRNFFQDVEGSLGVSDIEQIRLFLDAIQSIPPKAGSLSVVIPQPNITTLNAPTLTSANSYKTSMQLNWSVNEPSLALKTGVISGTPSVSEDVARYELLITAGTFNQKTTFLPGQAITRSVSLNWPSWFSLANIKNASIEAVLQVFDKRENTSESNIQFKFPTNVRMQVPIKSYQVEYKIDNNQWVQIGTPTTTSFLWTTLPEKTGTYTFRVRGLDELNAWTDWVSSAPKFIEYIVFIPPPPPPVPKPIPDPPIPTPPRAPDKPVPVATSQIYDVTATWNSVARAQKYTAWLGDDEAKAKTDTKNGNIYWVELLSTANRTVTFKVLTPETNYKVSVRATNEGGSSVGHTNIKTKARTIRKTSYTPLGHQVWNGVYNYKVTGLDDPAGWRSAIWKSTKDNLYHGGWEETNLGGGNWTYHSRGGGSYRAYNYQNWGNNMSFLYYNYEVMRQDLLGKEIKDVTISFSRTNSIHGYEGAIPLYIYNHNRDNNTSITTANAFKLFRADNRTEVSLNNQKVAYDYTVARGQNFSVQNDWTKQLVNNIVNNGMRGLGLVKYYGNNNSRSKNKRFYTNQAGTAVYDSPTNADKAYMIFKPYSTVINVTYYDN